MDDFDIGDEFAEAQLADRRHTRRLVALAQAMGEEPSCSFPAALDEAALEGAYRFFRNRKVDPEGILAPHIHRTIARIGDNDVLAVHDSTTMAFRSGGARIGLSETSSAKKQEFLAHVTLAVSLGKLPRPLGVLDLSTRKKARHGRVSATRRSREEFESDHDRWEEHVERVAELPLEHEKVVHVADREADDYRLVAKIIELRGRFVIRRSHDRVLLSNEPTKVSDALSAATIMGSRTISLSTRVHNNAGPKRKRKHPARSQRQAQVTIASTSVCIKRPKLPKNNGLAEGINVNVVHVFEPAPPSEEPAVEWVLFTSEPVSTAEECSRVVDIYRARWLIEEYFKALKTGCAYEKRQLNNLHALTNALAVFAPIAWRLLDMRSQTRQRPEAPASEILKKDELFVLSQKARKRAPLPENPTVRDAYRAIAGLGGALPKSAEPGWQIIATGYEKLMFWVSGYRLAQKTCEI